MRIMGLDFGERTIGVAVSDELLWTAQGVKTIRRSSQDKDIEELRDIVREYEVGTIVLGYPKNMNGTTGPRAESTKKFARKLEDELAVPVVLWDERLSTVAAERALLQGDVSRAKRKQVVDKMAAVLILQGYLDRQAHLDD